MAIMATANQKDWDLGPDGLHQAVCCDVVDLGIINTTLYGPKHMVQLRWQIDAIEPTTGKPYLILARYTLSIHKKAMLCQRLESWRGKQFTDEERKGFDLERLIGINCQLQIVHVTKGDATYANVQAIVPVLKGSQLLTVEKSYIRVKDRVQEPATTGGWGPRAAEQKEEEDDDLPF